MPEQAKAAGKNRNTLKCLLAAWGFVYGCCPAGFVALAGLSMLTVAGPLASILLAQFVGNTAVRLMEGTSAGFAGDLQSLMLYGGLIIGAAFARQTRELVQRYVKYRVQLRFEHGFYEKIAGVQWECLEEHQTNTRIFEARSKTFEVYERFIDESLNKYAFAFAGIFVFGWFLCQINLWVVGIYIVLLTLTTLYNERIFARVWRLWDEVWVQAQRRNYFFNLAGDKTGHQEFRFLRLLQFVHNRWREHYRAENKLRVRALALVGGAWEAQRLVANIPFIAMLIWVSWEIVQGRHDIGFLLLCRGMLNTAEQTFMDIGRTINNDKERTLFYHNYLDILKLPDEKPVTTKRQVGKEVAFTDTVYHYPQSEHKALDGMSLTIGSGEKIAIVGHNGSGKTTFTNLLMALTENYQGKITVDGSAEDVHDKLRNSISGIMQDFTQYQMSIRDNIALGDIKYDFSDAEIRELLERVGLRETVENLPHGIHSKLGQLDDRGIELSKGQWQRIAIARLLAKKDATIWILDEPTAYLDPLAEIEMYNMIYDLAGERTVLFISHRLGFAKRADRIIVFSDGKVTEQGHHDDLIASCGVYSEMYNAQKEWYLQAC